MWRPTAEDLIEFNRRQLGDGSLLRDRNRLEAAVERPWQSAGGEDAYPDIDMKAAVLLDSVSNEQAFVDGNKRTATQAVRLLYSWSGFDLVLPLVVGYDLHEYVASVRPIDYVMVAETLALYRTPIVPIP